MESVHTTPASCTLFPCPHRYFSNQPRRPPCSTTPNKTMAGDPEFRRSQTLRHPTRSYSLTPAVFSFRELSTKLSMLSLLHVLALLVLVPQVMSFATSSFITPRLTSFESWEHEALLEESGAFVVQWTPREESIEFRVTARTTGYIGFGLSSKPRMDGADIVVGWVHSGKAYLQDRHGRGNQEPSVDDQRDWMLVGGYENDTHTVLIMSRPYNTCDKHDHVISNDTVRLLWAYHPDDPVDPESPRPRLHYHGASRRGAKSMFLLERGQKIPSNTVYSSSRHPPLQHSPNFSDSPSGLPPSPPQHPGGHYHHHQRQHHHHHHHSPLTRSWLLTNPGVEVAATSDTVYWCKVFKRPNLVQKNHVIRYEPVFTAGNEQYVHHMIVYECTDLGNLNPEVDADFEVLASSAGHGCYQADTPHVVLTCNHVVVAWAVGSEGLSLPPEAGYPLTPKGPKFYMLEVHYDNPNSHTFKDESGIRIIYTPELRYYDAGVLSIGLEPSWKHLIPPRQRTVLSEGHCVAECTQAALPTTGINVFAVILHTHLLGRKVRVRHLRQGRELEPIAQDNNYDFNYQEYRALKIPRTVLPGDHLIGECTYNSRERSSITLGGFKTRDEMCLSYLFYWPRVDLSLCHSKPSLNTVLHSLGIEELSANSDPIKIRRPIELAGKSLEWRLMNYDWKNQFDYFQQTTHSGTFNPICWRRGESLIPEAEKLDYEYPNITESWVSENVCRQRRKKSKRRKLKNGRGKNRHLLPNSDMEEGEEEEEEEEEEEVMFDDQTNSRPIERIDVDPFNHVDVFMPVIEERVENDPFGVDESPNQELEQELLDMERDLEKELADKYPDAFHERTEHQNREGTGSSSCLRVVTSQWTFSVCLCVLSLARLFYGHG
ncbi:DBH-like monooxygenase protein 1 [Procambarus clarkii]|uniref:DBH-like monooxygenase protein 1 n=1 Tax=Procambarus clarkii TaxID=6728 RepID=UPI001E6718B3|nr:DBH-like monooxygenase protein 1 [Procambarus clarkii]